MKRCFRLRATADSFSKASGMAALTIVFASSDVSSLFGRMKPFWPSSMTVRAPPISVAIIGLPAAALYHLLDEPLPRQHRHGALLARGLDGEQIHCARHSPSGSTGSARARANASASDALSSARIGGRLSRKIRP